MDILELTLKDYKLFSPVTGQLIYDARKNILDEDEKSFVACWHYDSVNLKDYYKPDLLDGDVHFFLYGITTDHPELFRDWEYYLIDCSHPGENTGEAGEVDVENFILSYEKYPDWKAIRIEKPGLPKTIAWVVVDMSTNPEENAD